MRRRRYLLPAVAALVVAALVAIGGAVLWQVRPMESRAVSTLVVLPSSEGAEVASYYDTLSSGQIASTFAEILALRGTAGSSAGTDLEVRVVPGTSLIRLTATAADAETAEAAADRALARSRPFFDELSAPYSVFEVRSAAGTAENAGLAPGLLTGVVAAVAVIAGLATYLAVHALQSGGMAVRPRDPALRPAVDRRGRDPRTLPQAAVASAALGDDVSKGSPPRTDPPLAEGWTAQPAK